MREIDFGRTAADYANFRHGFPAQFFQALRDRGLAPAEADGLDLGTGTGSIARGLARLGLRVTGVDPAVALLNVAARLDREAGVSVTYREGVAESTELPDNAFDLVTAGQCWHWFDRRRAATESRRLLRSGGVLAIAHLDWLPLARNVVEMTESLVLAHNPRWTMAGGTGIYPDWARDLGANGFGEIESFSFDLLLPYTHEQWTGRVRASAGVGGSLDAAAVEQFGVELRRHLAEWHPQDEMHIPHRVWCIYGRRS